MPTALGTPISQYCLDLNWDAQVCNYTKMAKVLHKEWPDNTNANALICSDCDPPPHEKLCLCIQQKRVNTCDTFLLSACLIHTRISTAM